MRFGRQNKAAVIILRKPSLQSLSWKNAEKPSRSQLVLTLLCSASSCFLARLAKWQASPAPDAWLRGKSAPLLRLSSATGCAQLPYKLHLLHTCQSLGEFSLLYSNCSFQMFASPAPPTFEKGLDTHAVSLACRVWGGVGKERMIPDIE